MKAGHYSYVAPDDVQARIAAGWTSVSETAGRVLMTKPFGWMERNRFYWEPAGDAIRVFDRKLGTGDYDTSRHIAECADADIANAIVEALNERELR